MGYNLLHGDPIGETFDLDDAWCIRASEKALLIAHASLREPCWVPLSQISEESEVAGIGDAGCLVVTEWFAEQRRWTKLAFEPNMQTKLNFK